MHTLASLLLVTAPLLVRGAPLKRQANPTDVLVLSELFVLRLKKPLPKLSLIDFANVLEQLETQFYTQALNTFSDSDFIAAGYVDSQLPSQQFQVMQGDESTHASVLQVRSLHFFEFDPPSTSSDRTSL